MPHASNVKRNIAGPVRMDGLPVGGVPAALKELSQNPGRMIRFGIIGMGFMGHEHRRFLKILEQEGVACLTRVADPSLEQLEMAKTEAPGVAGHLDYKELLAADDVDAVIIASPNHTHIEVLRSAVAARPPKHILCEKPLGTSKEQCAEAEELVAKLPDSCVFWMGMEYRYMPMIADLVGRVDDGAIGSLKMLHIREHRFPFMKKVGNWNRFNSNTGGTLVEKCCHFFDLMRRLTGSEPLRVFATGAQDVNHLQEPSNSEGQHPDILDNAFVIVDMANGCRACLDLCMFAEDRQSEEVVAVGTNGKLSASSQPELLVGFIPRTADGSSPVPPAAPLVEETIHQPKEELLQAGSHEGATYFQLHAFCLSCRSASHAGCKRKPAVSLHDGIRSVEMGLAAQQSIEQSCVVVLDSTEPVTKRAKKV